MPSSGFGRMITWPLLVELPGQRDLRDVLRQVPEVVEKNLDAWFAALVISLWYDVSDDLASPFIGDHYARPQAISAFLALALALALSTALLGTYSEYAD